MKEYSVKVRKLRADGGDDYSSLDRKYTLQGILDEFTGRAEQHPDFDYDEVEAQKINQDTGEYTVALKKDGTPVVELYGSLSNDANQNNNDNRREVSGSNSPDVSPTQGQETDENGRPKTYNYNASGRDRGINDQNDPNRYENRNNPADLNRSSGGGVRPQGRAGTNIGTKQHDDYNTGTGHSVEDPNVQSGRDGNQGYRSIPSGDVVYNEAGDRVSRPKNPVPDGTPGAPIGMKGKSNK